MRKGVLACAAIVGLGLVAAAASAQDAPPPSYFSVAPLAKDDALAVRSAPDAAAPQLGGLPGGAGPIEVLATARDGAWAQIQWLEGDAWIATRFLEPAAPPLLPDTALPIGLICSGTEPFWGFEIETDQAARWRSPLTGEDLQVRIDWSTGAAGRLGAPAALHASADGFSAVMIFRPALCSDGMTDRTYGWSAALQTSQDGQPVLFEGCCRLPTPR